MLNLREGGDREDLKLINECQRYSTEPNAQKDAYINNLHIHDLSIPNILYR